MEDKNTKPGKSGKANTDVAVTGNTNTEVVQTNSGVKQTKEALKNMLKMVKDAKPEDLITITGDYLELEVGSVYDAVIVGLTVMQDTINESGLIDAAALILESEDGEDVQSYINADIVMVSTARKLAEAGNLPYPCQIHVHGLKGPKGREYKDLEIKGFTGINSRG